MSSDTLISIFLLIATCAYGSLTIIKEVNPTIIALFVSCVSKLIC